MSDMAGYSGALLLSSQLAQDRFFDGLAEARRNNAEAADLAWLNNALDTMIARHNAAVRAHNTLLRDAQAYERRVNDQLRQQDQRIAQLEQELGELRAAKAESDEKVMNYAAERANRVMSGLQ